VKFTDDGLAVQMAADEADRWVVHLDGATTVTVMDPETGHVFAVRKPVKPLRLTVEG